MATARFTPKLVFCSLSLAFAMFLMQASQAAAAAGRHPRHVADRRRPVESGCRVRQGCRCQHPVFSGKVSWLKEPTRDGEPVNDAKNENAALRDRPILGLAILSGFKFTGPATWAGGELYAPRNGKSFPAVLTLTPDGRLQVKVNAGIVSKTVYWTR